MLTKMYAGETKVLNERKRVLRAVVSAEVVDRDGDVIVSKGLRPDDSRQTPIVFWSHQSRELPIGKTLEIGASERDVQAAIPFAGEEHRHPFAAQVFNLYSAGFLSAWSIGFLPVATTPEKRFPNQRGRTIAEATLLEVSRVGIFSNPNTTTQLTKSLRSLGWLTLPDGATEADLGKALGTAQLKHHWHVAQNLIPALGAAAEESMPDTFATREGIAELFKAAVEPVFQRIDEVESKIPGGTPSGSGDDKPAPIPFAFGKSVTSRGPAHLRSGRGEAGLSFTAIFKSLQAGTKTGLAWDIHQKLVDAGYIQTDARSILVPMGAHGLVRTPGHEAAIEEVTRTVKDAFAYDCGLDELAIVTRQMRGAYQMKAPQDPGDDTLGGAWIPPAVLGAPIDLLRPLSVVMAAGARNVPVPPGGTTAFPRQTGDPTFYWTPPNTPITESNVNTGVIILGQKKLAAIIKVPNECLPSGRIKLTRKGTDDRGKRQWDCGCRVGRWIASGVGYPELMTFL